jgi:hypothetical protein
MREGKRGINKSEKESEGKEKKKEKAILGITRLAHMVVTCKVETDSHHKQQQPQTEEQEEGKERSRERESTGNDVDGITLFESLQANL